MAARGFATPSDNREEATTIFARAGVAPLLPIITEGGFRKQDEEIVVEHHWSALTVH